MTSTVTETTTERRSAWPPEWLVQKVRAQAWRMLAGMVVPPPGLVVQPQVEEMVTVKTAGGVISELLDIADALLYELAKARNEKMKVTLAWIRERYEVGIQRAMRSRLAGAGAPV